MFGKNIGTEKAMQKIRHFCAYQERSHAETRDKLYSFGLYKNEVEQLLSDLIQDNYLNEERFAIAFAGGRFRLKQWGKVKIQHELKQRQVSEYCINLALKTIDDEVYRACLSKLAYAKLATLKSERSIFTRKAKLQAYLLQKGYEPNLVAAIVHAI